MKNKTQDFYFGGNIVNRMNYSTITPGYKLIESKYELHCYLSSGNRLIESHNTYKTGLDRLKYLGEKLELDDIEMALLLDEYRLKNSGDHSNEI